MLRTILIPAVMLSAGAPALRAQAEYHVRAGAIGASRLVRDFVTEEIEVRQSIAPMVALGGSLPISPGYRANLEATLSSGGFHAEESGVESDLGTLRTGSVTVGLEGPVWGSLRWRLGLGALLYSGPGNAGIFQSGSGPRLLAGAGADWRRPVMSAWDLMAAVRYDYHRFTTDELERRGFSQAQGVSRVSASIGLSRGLR